MYIFKYYFDNGSEKYEKTSKKLDISHLSELAKKITNEHLNCYKVEILDKNNRIMGYYNKNEELIDDIYQEMNGSIDNFENEDENDKKILYSFKFYFTDGTSKCMGKKSFNPNELYADFDGLMDWDEYDNLKNKNLTTQDILKMAFDLYTFLRKRYYRIEIINCKTNEIIDYIEERGDKNVR